jgi:hypothetical protein
MTQETSQKPKTMRGAVLGHFLAAQRLQAQGGQQSIPQGPAEGSQVGQGQRFTLENALGKVDEMRLQMRQRSGFRPGLLMDRRNQRRSEFLQAFNQPQTTKVEDKDPEPEQPKPAAPTQPVLECPWANEGCTFKTDSPDALKDHVAIHTRAKIRTY